MRNLKSKWNKFLGKKIITYDPDEGIEKSTFEKAGLKLIGLYNPKREERFALPSLAENLSNDRAFICTFNDYDLTMLANKKPIFRYHGMLLKQSEIIEQNVFDLIDLKKTSEWIENHGGTRGWRNMCRGGAASIDRSHSQFVFDALPIEDYPVVKINENLGYVDYPAGNIFICGSGVLEKRIDILARIIEKYRKNFKNWDMLTLKKDNTLNDNEAIYTILWHKGNIVWIPRKRETPDNGISDSSGGLEIGGIFSCTKKDEFEKLNYEILAQTLKSVSFPQNQINENFADILKLQNS
ncbi:MAG: hypothetical protein FWG34_01275 [Oscillospiraceae bacterium]|nr:hypothetical protein [Oscillospiraceae bacterium]